MTTPYRTPGDPTPATREPTKRCCGVCPHAIGGCIHNLQWTLPWWLGGETVYAGMDETGKGTLPRVCINGKWKPET